ncbi:MAG: magnesium transporter [Dehalococcoidia bacterium]|nr:magnesium transporter [Dehalococcoidia bacterium]
MSEPHTVEIIDQRTFEDLASRRQFKDLRLRLVRMDPSHIASLVESLPSESAVLAYRLLPKDLGVKVFDLLESTAQYRLLESFTDQGARVFLEALPPDDRADLLEEVPAVVARRLLQLLSPEQRRVTLELLGYEEGTAGREMTPAFVDLHGDMTIKQALERIRRLAVHKETVYESYVIDHERHLVGSVSLMDLVLARPDTRVGDIMKPSPKRVSTSTDREQVVRVLRDYDLLAVPVVDSEERLVGIITHDDVTDIIEEETTEDIYRFGAVPGTERGYFTSRILTVVRRRVIWLFLLILVNTVTGSIIAGQEGLLSEIVILAAFIPLLIGTGGNVGAQSATVVIRGLATGEINPRRAAAIVAREVGIGLLLGILLGLTGFGWSYLLGRNLEVAVVVALALVAISTLATATGALLPFIFRFLRVDPAMVSAPLITTVMDIFGILVYFGAANVIVRL